MSAAGQIWLKPDHFDSRGNNPPDGASAYDEIRDTCSGCVAKRYDRITLSRKFKQDFYLRVQVSNYAL